MLQPQRQCVLRVLRPTGQKQCLQVSQPVVRVLRIRFQRGKQVGKPIRRPPQLHVQHPDAVVCRGMRWLRLQDAAIELLGEFQPAGDLQLDGVAAEIIKSRRSAFR